MSLFKTVLTVFACVRLATGIAVADESSDLYGFIEIGASGLKPVVVQSMPRNASSVSAEQGEDTAVEPYRIVEEVPVEEVNALNESSAERVAAATDKVFKAMLEIHHVPKGNIFVVGSSGLAAQKSRAAIEQAVNTKVGCAMEFISAEDEAILAFAGVLDRLPSGVREKRRGSVLFIDIGSGNTRGTYLSSKQPLTYTTFVIPWGTKSFAKAVNEERKEGGDFVKSSEEMRRTVLFKSIQDAVANYPGLQNLDRVYLAGGASFAMATLMEPEAKPKGDFVPIKPADIENFRAATTTNLPALLSPTLSHLSDSDKQKVSKSIGEIKTKIFSGDQLVAAAQILYSLDLELAIKGKRKTVFFARSAKYSWPLGYLAKKIGEHAK